MATQVVEPNTIGGAENPSPKAPTKGMQTMKEAGAPPMSSYYVHLKYPVITLNIFVWTVWYWVFGYLEATHVEYGWNSMRVVDQTIKVLPNFFFLCWMMVFVTGHPMKGPMTVINTILWSLAFAIGWVTLPAGGAIGMCFAAVLCLIIIMVHSERRLFSFILYSAITVTVAAAIFVSFSLTPIRGLLPGALKGCAIQLIKMVFLDGCMVIFRVLWNVFYTPPTNSKCLGIIVMWLVTGAEAMGCVGFLLCMQQPTAERMWLEALFNSCTLIFCETWCRSGLNLFILSKMLCRTVPPFDPVADSFRVGKLRMAYFWVVGLADPLVTLASYEVGYGVTLVDDNGVVTGCARTLVFHKIEPWLLLLLFLFTQMLCDAIHVCVQRKIAPPPEDETFLETLDRLKKPGEVRPICWDRGQAYDNGEPADSVQQDEMDLNLGFYKFPMHFMVAGLMCIQASQNLMNCLVGQFGSFTLCPP